jgi:hypothetical protein
MLIVIALQSSIERCPSRTDRITRRRASRQGENFQPPYRWPLHHWIVNCRHSGDCGKRQETMHGIVYTPGDRGKRQETMLFSVTTPKLIY